ncbi:hypothetical protein CDL15_Pgr019584 [Punica granatum]|uniref:Protein DETOXIFICATION n=1 Tax=Punica granatum TaxID=22663 RepID=A0A218X5U4_PUNGR|nr:hypothetical protein CDL15_Pgr019584 [Punica granatum]
MLLCRTLAHSPSIPLLRRSRPSRPLSPPLPCPPNFFFKPQSAAASLLLKPRSFPGIRCISSHGHGTIEQGEPETGAFEAGGDDFGSLEEERPVVAAEAGEKLAEQGLWKQMTEIVKFAGPATGLWICGPLMSLIDTAVVGQGSSTELAALGPATVLSDSISYIFMFLSIATSNMVATSLARQDKNEVQHQISILLFVGLTCGFFMLLFTKFFGSWALTGFTGSKNVHLVPAANTYVQVHFPVHFLGMKDSWGPLKALAVASAVNGIGDIILCIFMDYGIAGAAWATMVSQVIAAYMMITSLNEKGYNAYAVSVPSIDELMSIIGIAAPAFVTMMSKVAFFSLLTYVATSTGTITVAAHQVVVQLFFMGTVWGEPLCQTAQSFMPELIYGAKRSLEKAGTLLKSLVIIGVILGVILGSIGTVVLQFFPSTFTSDHSVIREVHKVLIPYFIALSVTPPTLSLEGTLLAGRDLKFISASMSGCFVLGSILLLLVSSKGFGLVGCWYALSGFQWARFLLALQRLISPNSILNSEDLSRYKLEKLKTA